MVCGVDEGKVEGVKIKTREVDIIHSYGGRLGKWKSMNVNHTSSYLCHILIDQTLH